MPLIQTREKICRYIGENKYDFLNLVKKEKLPVWRTKTNGTWKARPQDLDKWIDEQAEKYLELSR